MLDAMPSPSQMIRKSLSRKGPVEADLEAAAAAAASAPVASPGSRPASGKMARRASFSLRASLNTAKYSEALEAVKSEQDEEKDTLESTRVWLKKFMSNSKVGSDYENFILLISFVSMLEFIYQTYLPPGIGNNNAGLDRLRILELCFIGFFFGDWLLNLFIADDKTSYACSFLSIIDILTIISTAYTYRRLVPVMTLHSSFRDIVIYFIFACRNMRILRALRIDVKLGRISDAVQRYLGEVALYALVFMLFFAAMMQYLEAEHELKFHTWTYFVVVTASSVGYGDIIPRSTMGRIFVMFIIGCAIISVPTVTNELIEKMNLQSAYMRAMYTQKSKNGQHIVICGDLTSTSLRDFFDELFHEDHENVDLSAVMMLPLPPTIEIIFLMRDPKFFLQLQYLEGSALVEKDLRRSKAEYAMAIFIMTNKFSTNPDEEDAKSILLNLSIKRYIAGFYRPPMRFCMQLIRPENRRHLSKNESNELDSNDLVLCLNEIKMGAMAKAILYPGANTLLMNLVSSFADGDDENDGEESEIQFNTVSGKTVKTTNKAWVEEYKKGCGWEIYTTKLSRLFIGAKFAELSYALYERKGVVLFALQMTDKKQGGPPRLVLNPADFVIPNQEDFELEAFVIAQNQLDADLTLASSSSSDAPASTEPSHQQAMQRMNRNFSTITGMMNIKGAGAIEPIERRRSSVTDANRLQNALSNSPENPQDQGDGDGKKSPSGAASSSSSSKKKVSRWKVLKRRNLLERKVQSNSYQEIIHRLEDEHFKENYYIVSPPLDLASCTVTSSVLEEIPFINQHLIIIGKGLRNLYDLIRPLRAKYIGPLRYIVLLYPDEIPHDVWQRISMFDALIFVRGSPLEESNLRRAGIFRAAQVIVLADGSNSDSASIGMEALVDADAIFAYQHVKRMNPSTKVVLEIVNQSNISYLNDQSTLINNDPKFTPQFAAGTLFTSSLLDSIVCQVYYNPQIIKVINKLTSGIDQIERYELVAKAAKEINESRDDGSGGSSDEEDGAAGSLSRKSSSRRDSLGMPPLLRSRSVLNAIHNSCLYQISIPDNLEKKIYGCLYQYLASRGKIPLGLLRGTFTNMNMGPKSNRMPYVYTNPEANTELYTCDKVFVLSMTPERAEDRVEIKDWLLDIQMQTNLNSRKEAAAAAANESHGPASVETLEKRQKKLEEKVGRASSEIGKKLRALMDRLQDATKSSRSGSPTRRGSGGGDGAPAIINGEEADTTIGRTRTDSLNHGTGGNRSRLNSTGTNEDSIDGEMSGASHDTNDVVGHTPSTTSGTATGAPGSNSGRRGSGANPLSPEQLPASLSSSPSISSGKSITGVGKVSKTEPTFQTIEEIDHEGSFASIVEEKKDPDMKPQSVRPSTQSIYDEEHKSADAVPIVTTTVPVSGLIGFTPSKVVPYGIISAKIPAGAAVLMPAASSAAGAAAAVADLHSEAEEDRKVFDVKIKPLSMSNAAINTFDSRISYNGTNSGNSRGRRPLSAGPVITSAFSRPMTPERSAKLRAARAEGGLDATASLQLLQNSAKLMSNGMSANGSSVNSPAKTDNWIG